MKSETILLGVLAFMISLVIFSNFQERFVLTPSKQPFRPWEHERFSSYDRDQDLMEEKEVPTPLSWPQHRFSRQKVNVYSEVDRPVVLANAENHVVVRVGLISGQAPEDYQRVPLNIAIVLDRSGSMTGQKLEDAKQGAIDIIEKLTSGDIISLVAYESLAKVVIPAQPLRDKASLIQRIRNIQPGGSTAMYDGIICGQQELQKYFSPRRLNRMVLLSDGLANVGPSSSEELGRLGFSFQAEGINISTVGLGLDYNEELMAHLAARSGGHTYFAEDSDQLPEIFMKELGKALTLMAKNIHILVECSSGVSPLGTIGPHGQIKGEGMQAYLPQLYGEDNKYVLFKLRAPSRRHGDQKEIARIDVEYEDPFTHQIKRAQQTIVLRYDKNTWVVERSQNKGLIKDVALRESAEMREQAIARSKSGDYQQAAEILKNNSRKLEKASQICDNDLDLIKESQQDRDLSDEVMIHRGIESESTIKSYLINAEQEFWG